MTSPDAEAALFSLKSSTSRETYHDLTLAGAQGVETLSERTQDPIMLATGSIASEARLDSIKKILVTEWLGQKLADVTSNSGRSSGYM